MQEEWKDIDWIPNLRGTYQISSLGSVKRTSYIRHEHYSNTYQIVYKDKIIKSFDNGNGYKVVSFRLDTENGVKKKNFYVHILVAKAFIDNPLNKQEVNHKNYIRSDNKVSNLEWCDRTYNLSYSNCHTHHPRKKTSGIRLHGGKYEVAITHNQNHYYLGRFSDYEEALKIRKEKYKELGVVKNV